ncbi:MAG TPA: sigma-70 family RNA polymerase sigma factor [Puia sp.]|nr:sigma-70 family RNA polymerase sigma factor [Puia sp.]
MMQVNNDNERCLLHLIAEGHKPSYSVIYDRYWKKIYATALHYLRSPQWAQDLVQDIFLKIWIKRTTLAEVNDFESFLFIVARNELVSAIRKKVEASPLQEQIEPMATTELPDNAVSLKQTEQLLADAIARLPPQQKLVFTLTRQRGLSHEAIARQLGLNTRTVNNHATRAILSIRQYLQKQGHQGAGW